MIQLCVEKRNQEENMKLLNNLRARKDANIFMKQFSNRKTENRIRKIIVKFLAHKDGPEWRAIALKQQKEVDNFKELFQQIKNQS
jgi:hypothetical protein